MHRTALSCTIAPMLYLVDGYNVTRSDPATCSLAIEEQRDRLVSRLRVRGTELLGPGRIVIVFDGSEYPASGVGGTAPVEVRFSRGESADDLIVRMAEGAGGRVCVVTSDAGLRARVTGALPGRVEVRGRESVYDAARGDRGRRRRTKATSGRDDGCLGVPPGGNRITEDLKKLWLDEQDER